MENQREVYLEEANELLTELETSLLELESAPHDGELIGRVFRALHTIKGSGAMFGFDEIAEFTHEIETVFDRVRDGELAVDQELINLSLAARDQIKEMLETAGGGPPADAKRSEWILSELGRIFAGTDTAASAAATGACRSSAGEDTGAEIAYWIRFQPAADIFATGTNPLLLLSELRELGECHVMAQTDPVPMLDAIDPERCYTHWDIVLTTDKGINAIRDVFIFVEDDCKLEITAFDGHDEDCRESDWKLLGEILMERGELSDAQLHEALASQRRLGEVLIERKLVSPQSVEAALAVQQHVRQVRMNRQEKAMLSSIRVDADKLDRLMDLVGELVTVQARLTRKADVQKDPELLMISEVVERLTMELRETSMRIRMLPIATTFAKFTRLVRDLSTSLGKEVEMTTDGGDTELDKTVIEKLGDPLVHIIRNSIDHGIEMPEQRQACGKPRQGSIHLSASHSGTSVVIRISDDGAGLNPEAIRRKAAAKGLIAPDAVLTEKETFSLVFQPGFSTADQVTDISGRGVGMDVVKSAIDALRGSIEIDSRTGCGTTVVLKLPLTLAIIDGLVVKIGDTEFVIPLHAVEECVELDRAQAVRAHARNMMPFRGKMLPYVNLREQFGIAGRPPDTEQVVVVESGSGKMGVGVDRIVGQHQTVIKTLGKLYRDVEGFSGATIMGDGSVALILDVACLASAAAERRNSGS